MSSAIDLTTLAAVEAYLGLPAGSPAEPLLSTLITAASQFIMSYCNRIFQAQSYTEYRDGVGYGVSELVTLGYPIISVQSVLISGNVIPSANIDQFPRSGFYAGLWYIGVEGYSIPRGRKNVKLVYTAGYAVIPADLSEACTELVALKYKQKDRIGISGSEGIDGQHISFKDIAMSAATQQTLMQYKRVIQITQ